MLVLIDAATDDGPIHEITCTRCVIDGCDTTDPTLTNS